jgi:hypothetical protein
VRFAPNSFITVSALSPTLATAASTSFADLPRRLRHCRTDTLLEISTQFRDNFGLEVIMGVLLMDHAFKFLLYSNKAACLQQHDGVLGSECVGISGIPRRLKHPVPKDIRLKDAHQLISVSET